MGGDGFLPSFGEKGETFLQFGEEGLSDFWIGTGFVAHHERKRGGISDGMGGGVVCKFRHGKKFGPFRRLIFGKDPKVCFKLLVDPFRFAISLGVISGGEGDVVIEKTSEFSCKGRGKLGSLVRDDSVMKAELGKDVLEEDFSDVCRGGGLVARAENYPLRKTMVYHDQNRIIAVGKGKVGDQIHGDLLERAGAFGRDRGQQGVGGVGVHFVGLASSAASDKFTDEGGHARPPIVFLEQGDCAEITAVGTCKGFVDILNKGVAGGLGDVEAALVIEGALVEVPVLQRGAWQRDGAGFHGGEGVNDELVGRGAFGNFGS